MLTIRLIQIGDIHFPKTARIRRKIDDKDDSFPALLRDMVSASPLRDVFKTIHSIIQTTKVHALCLVGDLTDIGDLQNYAGCAEYIYECFGPHENPDTSPPLIIVPGNHDINRELSRLSNPRAKFKPLRESLFAAKLPLFSLDSPTTTDLSNGIAQATAISLNSCWGCGSPLEIPDHFATAIDKAIDKTLRGQRSNQGKKEEEQRLRAYYNNQLDTPAFRLEELTAAAKLLNALPASKLPVFMAHHNLLPQNLPRISPYTEVLNSGQLRSLLLQSKRDVLYLHGHTHDPTIECVSGLASAKAIFVGSPLITDGFNVLDLTFSDSGAPIGIKISPWRMNQSGLIIETENVKLSVGRGSMDSREPQLGKLYGALLLHEQTLYWDDVVQMAKTSAVPFDDASIRRKLEILLFDGKIDIPNFTDDCASWQVQVSR